MASKWTRAQRKRYKQETPPADMRPIFLTKKIRGKRKKRAQQVAARLLRKGK